MLHSTHRLQVRCRTPEELEKGVPEEEVREREAAFFQAHPELQKVSCRPRPSRSCS